MNKIYYFSGTGNSLSAAKELGVLLGNCEVIRITPGTNLVAADAESVGLVFPVYCWGLPRMVYDFINRLVVDPGAYVYSVATYGGMLGATNRQVQDLLRVKGRELSGGFSIRMPGNYIPMYDIASEETQRELFRKKAEKLQDIAAAVRERKTAEIESSMGFLGKFLIKKVYPKAMEEMKKGDREFAVDPTCVSCGLCSRVCPAENIAMVDGRPKWKHNCESCFSCMHWCPQRAIQWGKKTRTRGRYHNSSVSVQEMLKR